MGKLVGAGGSTDCEGSTSAQPDVGGWLLKSNLDFDKSQDEVKHSTYDVLIQGQRSEVGDQPTMSTDQKARGCFRSSFLHHVSSIGGPSGVAARRFL